MSSDSKTTHHYKVHRPNGEGDKEYRRAVDFEEDPATGTLTLEDWEGFKVAAYARGQWDRVEMVGEPSAE